MASWLGRHAGAVRAPGLGLGLGLGLLLGLGSGTAAWAQNRALVVYDSSDPNQGIAAGHVRDILLARGFTVDDRGNVPADLSSYCCASDIRPFIDLSDSDRNAYRDFLGDGHGLLLIGENIACCEFRNQSIVEFINNWVGGGTARTFTERLGVFSEDAHASHPVTVSPHNINRVSYDGRGAANWDDPGRGTAVTFDNNLGSRVAAAWDTGRLLATPDGRLVSVLDINWMVDQWSVDDNEKFLENIVSFLCPAGSSSLSVAITSPSGFNLECPATVTVQGTVDGSSQSCGSSLRSDPPPGAELWQPDPETLAAGDPLADALPRAPSPSDGLRAGFSGQVRTALPAIAAQNVISIRVSVNGGPFGPVTSTSRALPAPPPIDFTAANLALRLGSNTIVIEARDDLGNRVTDSVTGTLRDTLPPTIDPATCLDVVVDLGAGCALDYDQTPTATDLCDPTVTFVATPPLPISFPGPGTVVVSYEARDDAGNKDTCSRSVTARDISGPTLSCAAPATVECKAPGGTPSADPEVQAFLAGTTAVDNCALDSLVHDAPAFFDSGCTPGKPTTVNWLARDQSGNESSCASVLSVVDTTPPAFSSRPGPLALECAGPGGVPKSDARIQAFLAGFAGSDICSAALTTRDDAPALFPAGCAPGQATLVTVTLADDCGNDSPAAESVTVVDTTAPDLSVPAPIVIECNGPGGVAIADPQIQAWIAAAVATDLCGSAVLVHDAPALLPSGCGAGTTTTVTFTATDGCGLATVKTSTITVRDTAAPALTVPGPLTLECNGPGGIAGTDAAIQAWLGSALASDLCGSVTLSNDAPALFPSGCGSGAATPVTFTASDDCGNRVSAVATVTVRDTTAPSLTVPLPLTLECTSPGGIPSGDPQVQAWLAVASAADICDGATLSNNVPALLPAGCGAGTTSSITFTAVDNCANSHSQASSLTVRDTTSPTLTVPPPLVLECNSPGGVPRTDPQIQAWLGAAAASDICGSLTLANDAPARFSSACGAGLATTVTFTATDGCGNLRTLSSTVTVRDTTAPALTAPAALVLECNGPGGIPAADPQIQAWLASATAQDLCGTANLAHNAPAFFPSGCGAGAATTVTFTATDNCGNVATATATVTVRDSTAPSLTAPAPITLECNGPGGIPRSDPQIQAWLAAATASDVCDGASLSDDAPALFPSGCGAGAVTTVTFTATDNCGNVATRSATVTVRDTTAPALTVPAPITLECNSPGGVPLGDPQIQAWLGSATASDVCDGATLGNDAPALFPSGCAPGLRTTVQFTATDNCGNASLGASTVAVQDTTPPVLGPVAFDGICLWPPNHNFWCVDDLTTEVTASDICDPDAPEVRVLSCRSSQPEEGLGDGDFAPDCVLLASGRGVCVRSERDGRDPAGRVYSIEVGATDECNNRAARTLTISVPHDRSPHADCRKPNAGKDPRL